MSLFVTTTVMLILQLGQQAPANAPQSPKASIEGFVVRAGTNEPIARARITVNRTAGPGGAPLPQTSPPPNIPAVTTDSQGHFLLKDLDAGTYTVNAQRNGFARQVYGERAPGRPGTPLNIAAGQGIKDVVFRLVPGGTISGRVSDSTGEPLAGITVQVLRSTYDQNGKRTFQTTGSGRTNDRGEYRIYWVTPGRYYVNASPGRSPLDGLPFSANSNEILEPGYVVTYYPGTTDTSTAAAIDVQPGAELSTIDFTLTQQQQFRVRGRVFDARTGQSPRNVSVSITPRNPTVGFVISNSPLNYNASNGTFELREVVPGSYWVRAISFPEPGAGVFTSADLSRNTAQTAVDVSNADVENVVLAFTAGFSVNGRIDLEGASLSSIPDFDRTRVYLSPNEQGPSFLAPQAIKPDGTFTLENVQPGEYRVQIVPMPPNLYLKSARLGQGDALSGLSIPGPVRDSFEIVLSNQAGQIDGTIVDKDQKPMRAIQAILIPDRQRDRRDLYKFATADQNGHFMMRTVPPGDYKLFAWEDLEPGAYNDPDFVRKYEALGTPTKVSESSKLTVELKVISAVQ